MSERVNLAIQGLITPHGTISPITRKVHSAFFNCASGSSEYELIPHVAKKLDPEELKLFFRELYSQAERQITRLGLMGKAEEFGIRAREIEKPLSAEEQEALDSVMKKLASLKEAAKNTAAFDE